MRSKELAQKVGLSEADLSLLKNGHVKGVRFATLEWLCAALGCQPGDLLSYLPSNALDDEAAAEV